MNIDDHVKELANRAKTIEMWYDYSYSSDGPGFGMRSEDRDIEIDNTVWMLYGSRAYGKSKGTNLNTMNDIWNAKASDIQVTVGAQAIVSGCIIDVHLGQYLCEDRYISENTGKHTLTLKRIGV